MGDLRYKLRLLTQIMENFATNRVIATRPFHIVNVDFYGSVNVSLRIRCRAPLKMYVGVFVFSHLKVRCQKRSSQKSVSDNVTDFVGARRVLNARRSKGSAQHLAHRTAVYGPQRRRSTNSSTSVSRKGSVFAAARSYGSVGDYFVAPSRHFGRLVYETTSHVCTARSS